MSAYSDKVLLDGALFYWRLGESAGTTAVDQKGILNGAYVGTVVLGQAGALGGSGDTDKAVDLTAGEVDVPPDVRHYGALIWTVEAWVYPTTPAVGASVDAGIIVSLYNGSPIPFVLCYGSVEGAYSSNRRLWTGFFGAPWNKLVDPTDLPLNTWSHVVGTYDGTTLRLYRNGVQVASTPASGQQGNAPEWLLIGTNWGQSYSFPGRIDEAAFYPTALSAAQITAHYTAGTSASGPQTVTVGGRASAQSFGAITVKTAITKAVGSVTSAQSFGTPTIKTAIKPSAGGVPSAQSFGVPTVAVKGVTQIVPVQGVNPYVTVTSITGQVICGDGHLVGSATYSPGQFGAVAIKTTVTKAVGGVPSAQSFGAARAANILRPLGIPSAQGFGAVVAIGGPVWIQIGVSCPSAAAFGVPLVYLVWIRDSVCTDLDLALSSCTDLDLDESEPVEMDLQPLVYR